MTCLFKVVAGLNWHIRRCAVAPLVWENFRRSTFSVPPPEPIGVSSRVTSESNSASRSAASAGVPTRTTLPYSSGSVSLSHQYTSAGHSARSTS